MNQDPIINVALSSFFNTKSTSFVGDVLENVIDIIMYCSQSVEPFFNSRRGEFIVVIKLYDAWIEFIETSVLREFLGSSGCGVIGKFNLR